jgi:hypothetical protein
MLPAPSRSTITYGIPYLQIYWCLFIYLHLFCIVLYACCDLVIIWKFVMNVFEKKWSLPDALIIDEIPEGPIKRILNRMLSSRLYIIVVFNLRFSSKLIRNKESSNHKSNKYEFCCISIIVNWDHSNLVLEGWLIS